MSAPSYSRGVCGALQQVMALVKPHAHRPPTTFEILIGVGEDLRTAQRVLTEATASWAVNAALSGASWKQIGDALGITKQAAQQRYGSMFVDRQLPME